MECYCHLRNIQDKLSDGETPFRRRFGVPFNGPVMPFGAPNITLFLRNTSRDCISLEQKSCQVYFSVVQDTRVESEKDTLWSQTKKNWSTPDHPWFNSSALT